MLGTTQLLLAYYLGGGFVIFLGWAAALPTTLLGPDDSRRYLRRALAVALAGLAHPALALAARDVVGQVGLDLPTTDPAVARAKTVVNVLVVLSIVPVAAVVALVGIG